MSDGNSEKNNQHWAQIEEVGVYWGMRFLFLLYSVFGRTIFLIVLYPVVSYYFVVSTSARESSRDYIRKLNAFNPENKIKANLSSSYFHFMSFAESMADKLGAWCGKITHDDVVFHGKEEYLQQVEHGHRGALLIGSHLGNIEVCRALAGVEKGLKLNVLVHTKHAENFNRLINSVSVDNQLELMQVTELDAAMAIRLDEKISNGEFVVIVGDRIPVKGQGRTAEVNFLGENAHFPQGAFILASLLKCPVYTLFCLKQQNKYHIYFEHFSDRIKLPRKSRESALIDVISLYAQRLESYCLTYPLQWFNFYPFWTKPTNDGAISDPE